MLRSAPRIGVLFSLLPVLSLLAMLSCVQDQMTATGAESLFGKNKVNDTRYDWKEIQGDRFRIIYPAMLRQRALDVARIYESNLDHICQDLEVQFGRAIPVFIYPSQEEYETTHVITGLVEGTGGFTEFFKERVVFPVQSSDRRLEYLSLHEITHAVQLKYLLEGSYRSLQIVLTGILSPLWFLEGVAQYESRGWDAMSAMQVRDAVMDHRLIPLNQLRGFSHLPPHQIRLAYYQSDLFIQFLADTYGQESIPRFLRLMKHELNIHHALQRVTGENLWALDRSWRNYADGRLRVRGEGWQDPNRHAHLLTPNAGWNLFPRYSPDGSHIAFLSDWENEALDFSLYLLELSTGRLNKLKKRGLELSPFGWSHDGKRLVVVSDDDNRSDLFVYDLKRKTWKRIKQKLRINRYPSFLPGDQEVGFTATVNGFADIYRIGLNDGELAALTQTVNDEAYPCWSPDGNLLVFSREYQKQYDLILTDLRTGMETRLTETPYDELWPFVLPDSKTLLYVADQNGIFNLQRLDLQTGVTRTLSNVIGGIFSPQVSPDGQRLLFTYFRHGQYRIFDSPMLGWMPGVGDVGRP